VLLLLPAPQLPSLAAGRLRVARCGVEVFGYAWSWPYRDHDAFRETRRGRRHLAAQRCVGGTAPPVRLHRYLPHAGFGRGNEPAARPTPRPEVYLTRGVIQRCPQKVAGRDGMPATIPDLRDISRSGRPRSIGEERCPRVMAPASR